MCWLHSRAPIFICASAKASSAESVVRGMNSNNPLAVELESQNDDACQNVSGFSLWLKRRSSATTKRIYSNDQRVEPFGGIVGGGRSGFTRFGRLWFGLG